MAEIFFGNRHQPVDETIASNKFLQQVHGNRVILVTDPHQNTSEEEADALVTSLPDIKLCIRTADCAPILLESDGIIAAVHAGWRSAFSGIIQNSVDVMRSIGADQICAYIGPCIQQESYEVDKLFYNRFLEQSIENSNFFIGINYEKFLFDLPGYCKSIMEKIGVHEIHDCIVNTFELPEQFHSYRYQSKLGLPSIERQVSYTKL